MENNLNSILSGMAETSIVATDQVILVDPDTRQLNIPGVELVFGVEGDASSERKYFQFPRYVGNGLDLASCFIRVNYCNANGEADFCIVDDVRIDGDFVVFSWEIHPKVVAYKGQVKFVVCAIGPDLKTKWHTTLGTGLSLEGQETDAEIEAATEDGVAQLIAMVEAQTAAVKSVGAEQSGVVRAAAEAAQTAAVAEVEAKGVNALASIPADYTALGEAVDALTKGRAGAIVCEAEGDVISVSDASDMPMQGLRVFGRSTQDGTPTPDAPVEIESVENPTISVNEQTLKLTHTLPGIPVTSGGNYTDGDGQQWICDEVDFARGVYVKRINVVTYDGSSDEAINLQAAKDTTKTRLYLKNDALPTALNSDVGCLRADRLISICAGESGTYGGHEGVSIDRSGNLHIYIENLSRSTEVGVRAWLSEHPITIAYALASSIETAMSETELAAYRALHTNKPNTTILNDGGAHMAVAYAADTKLYIDNKIAALVGNN